MLNKHPNYDGNSNSSHFLHTDSERISIRLSLVICLPADLVIFRLRLYFRVFTKQRQKIKEIFSNYI